ncbi:hypothetical protein EVAR_69422_1 [Eumeta japonica]|uniref:Uncharacterized protein n=1 Tax=Eumeta variegata TaxID=151549 RepID=A0A4C1Z8D4_EUMVA|nr:hypothetical protein EVAR_69422_1 [Eumeta japonica]
MEQYGVTTRSGKTRTSPRGNDDSDEDTRTKTDSLATPHLQKRTRGVGQTRHTRTAAAQKAHPAKRVTRVTSQTTISRRAHDDPSNKADTSKNRTINGYN